MGDEGHNRSVAASALLARRLAPAIAPLDGAVEVLKFLAGNDHFALNLSMAAAKLCMDAAAHVPGSSLVTVMSRNGVEFGIRVAGTGDRWYTAPVGPAVGLFFPGYGPEDANPDMGDSAITETLGIGGFAMAASPSITNFGRPTQRPLHEVTADEMRAHQAAGQFPAGSMGPKVESALRFVDAGGRRSIVTSLERLPDALAGKAGTHISGRPDPERAQ